jgi:hypothetical protein
VKDFQTLLVGLIALSTALWAAKPVFGQLQAARRQAAVVAYETLSQVYATLRMEQDNLNVLRILRAENTALIFSLEARSSEEVLASINRYRAEVIKFRQSFVAMQNMQPWGTFEAQQLRSQIGVELLKWEKQIFSYLFDFERAVQSHGSLTYFELVERESHKLTPDLLRPAESLLGAHKEMEAIVRGELARIEQRLADSYSNFADE